MLDTSDYAYALPERLIAQEPAVPRDRSRLFVYDTQRDTVTFDHFDNLGTYLPPQSFLVLNETKVVPSRVTLHKATGGKVKVLFLVNEHATDENVIRIMVDRKVQPGTRLFFNTEEYAEVISQDKQLFEVRLSFPRTRLNELLLQMGTMPIPLYIKHSPLSERDLRVRYQTVFAKEPGSSAAPTASLHFTDTLLDTLEKNKVPRLFVTLHVGMGTFAPVTEKEIREKRLHEEWFEVGEKTKKSIAELQSKGGEMIAVGTTVVRTMESFARGKQTEEGSSLGKTDLFIYPPYEFRLVRHLITNFHLPESSLMMLVEAFLQHKGAKRHLVDLYKIAIREKFRFYSFGDAMFII